MTMTLDELKEAVADICAGCDSERSQFTNADLGDAIDAAIRERDELRAGRDAWAEQHASRVLELVAARERAVKAAAELAALKSQPISGPAHDAIIRFGCGEVLSHEEMCEIVNQAVCAGRELAALKAMIADAPVVTINDSAHIIGDGYVPSLRGKRVRLVVED